ncbi:MAG TPA: DUF2924 domain-containing protein [Bradyrhizobium sp.]|jgi:hypothetical protein|nr:DUF2924 domain-containing protein [Bradyrhizobium sp.]
MGRRSVTIGPVPKPARSVRDEVNALPDLDIKVLRQKWRSMMGKTAPPHIGKPLMVRILGYRIQAKAYGDLPKEVAAFLDKLGAGTPGQDNRAPLPILRVTPRSLSPGTLLTREWNGRTERVMVLADGFAWNGKTYDSLSSVARAITGTRWSGPAFFGLRGKEPRS